MSEISDKLTVARRLRDEYDICGQRIRAALANGDHRQALALTTRRALFPACLLETLIDAALEAQQVMERHNPPSAWEQERAAMRDIVNRSELAYLQAACCPDDALAQADACMPLLCALIGRL